MIDSPSYKDLSFWQNKFVSIEFIFAMKQYDFFGISVEKSYIQSQKLTFRSFYISLQLA